MKYKEIPIIDYDFVKTEVLNITDEGLKSIELIEAYKLILSVIDLTTLEGSDNEKKISEVCKKALSFKGFGEGIPNVAAVCFYPTFVKQAKELLRDTEIQVACVAGAFPSGQAPLNIRLEEVKFAIEQGADEIDMVISRGKFLEEDYDFIYHEVEMHKKVCGEKHLKVILETGEIGSLSNIYLASKISIDAGADFIKTSTGKINPAATLEAFYAMLLAIKDHYEKTGKMVGIKPAGGISEVKTAIDYFTVLEHILGQKWMNNTYFRIGASRLADKILDKIKQI